MQLFRVPWSGIKPSGREVRHQDTYLQSCALRRFAGWLLLCTGSVGDSKLATPDQLPQDVVSNLVDVSYAWSQSIYSQPRTSIAAYPGEHPAG
jgi:hypothetical protein